MRRAPAAVALSIADRQDGCLTHEQLVGAGLSLEEISGLLAKRIVLPVHRGLYVLATEGLDPRQLQTCALLRASPLGGLSHRSGCEVRGLLPVRADIVEVASSRRGLARALRTQVPMRRTGRPGTIITTRAAEPLTEITVIDGLPTLPLARCLVDLAGRHGVRDTRRAWREADFLGRLIREEIEQELQTGSRRPGTAAIRELLEREGVVGQGRDLRSRNERRFLKMIEAAGLPTPLVNAPQRFGAVTYRPDFFFVAERVAVEIDGSGHQRAFAIEADVAREIAMREHDIDVLRFPDDIAYARTAWCIEQLRERLGARRAGGRSELEAAVGRSRLTSFPGASARLRSK